MKLEFSAGGVVFKKDPSTRASTELSRTSSGQVYILLGQHSQHHGWVFPKGLIGDIKKDESKEDTAVREVEEETGVLAKIIQPLTPITYWYQFTGEKRKKTVYYFLMNYLSEDLSKKDDEMEQVEWLPINEVEKKLTYPSDKQVWQEARKLIQ